MRANEFIFAELNLLLIAAIQKQKSTVLFNNEKMCMNALNLLYPKLRKVQVNYIKNKTVTDNIVVTF